MPDDIDHPIPRSRPDMAKADPVGAELRAHRIPRCLVRERAARSVAECERELDDWRFDRRCVISVDTPVSNGRVTGAVPAVLDLIGPPLWKHRTGVAHDM